MPPSPLPKLGRYEILEELGKGAMGVVYLAKDPLIGRLVALKTFRAGFSARDQELEQFRSRFMREAQSAGILSHPNIVTIHDIVDEAESGVCFIAMEYVRGSNLKLLLQQPEPLPFEFVVSIVSQVADALDYAHSRGVIHRDVKPANILITADNKVKITDFGIARLGSSNLTVEGQLLGTPNYMSPEQIQGREVDHRADIFSLGVVLYEMLTRRKPFQGENLTVVTHRIVHEPFTPPGDQLRGLPAGLGEVLARALEKEPARRYPAASALAADLQRLLRAPVPAAVEDEDDTAATQEVPLLDGDATRLAPGRGPAMARALAGGRSHPVLLGAGFAGLLAVAALALVLATAGGRPPAAAAPPAPAAGSAVADEVARRLAEGRRLLELGNPTAALAEVVAAEYQRGNDPAVRALRQEVEQAIQEQQRTASLASRVAGSLAAARDALERGRFLEAKVAAEAVLSQVPGQEEASQVLAEAERRLAAERERQRAARPALPAPTPSPVPPAAVVAVATPPPAPPQVAREGTVVVDFFTEVSEGVLTIYADDRQIVREPFKFAKRKGFLRSEKQPGSLRIERILASGPVVFRVYVALPGQPTRALTVGGEVAGGVSRTLRVRVGPDGVASGSWQ
ncbi:MAG: serine/threonine protein kinase [Thermoanaerobaculia bacterium]|nr:serine/threonine protein kinase [Thermoanaerobaculia bacterium]